ncbi:hypothetical protein Sjap_021269 [Stephania japonica]|uniref:Uncharacterized protein n=1 Tax=Stephania japonica TaxID=461633 RepID=A0AAP0HSQ0_9MAGN
MPLSEVETLLKQVISPKASVLSVTPCTSWFFDSGCYNHITSQLYVLSNCKIAQSFSSIQTANGSLLT